MFEPHLEARCDALEIIGQQVLAKVPWSRDRRPGNARALIGAHEHTPALLADVNLPLEIDGMKLFRLADQLGHVAGDEILMLHGEDRQLDADHPADLASRSEERRV